MKIHSMISWLSFHLSIVIYHNELSLNFLHSFSIFSSLSSDNHVSFDNHFIWTKSEFANSGIFYNNFWWSLTNSWTMSVHCSHSESFSLMSFLFFFMNSQISHHLSQFPSIDSTLSLLYHHCYPHSWKLIQWFHDFLFIHLWLYDIMNCHSIFFIHSQYFHLYSLTIMSLLIIILFE